MTFARSVVLAASIAIGFAQHRAQSQTTATHRRASTFRVLQWNVSGEAWTTHADLARRILRHADPDILVLDEVSPSLGAVGVRRMLSGLRSPADTSWYVSFGEGGAYQRTVIASRDSVRAVPEFALVPFPDTGLASAAAAIPDSVVSHPTPAEGRTVGTNAALVRVVRQSVLVVGMDLTSSGAAGSWRDWRRRVEATAIRERLRSALLRWHPDAVVVAGDMNIVTGPAPLDTLIAGLAHSAIGPLRAADAVHFDRWTTWTWDGRGTGFNGGRLDIVAYSAGTLRLLNARVWNTELMPADTLRAHDLTPASSASINRHRPVVVDLAYFR